MQAAFDAVAAVGVDVPPGSVVCAAGADFEEATSASAVAFSDPPSLMPFSSSDKLDIECILSKLKMNLLKLYCKIYIKLTFYQ